MAVVTFRGRLSGDSRSDHLLMVVFQPTPNMVCCVTCGRNQRRPSVGGRWKVLWREASGRSAGHLSVGVWPPGPHCSVRRFAGRGDRVGRLVQSTGDHPGPDDQTGALGPTRETGLGSVWLFGCRICESRPQGCFCRGIASLPGGIESVSCDRAVRGRHRPSARGPLRERRESSRSAPALTWQRARLSPAGRVSLPSCLRAPLE